MGYTRAENTTMDEIYTIAKEKIFTKQDSLKDMRRFLEFAQWRLAEER